ncbi:hypothetical protein [Mesorhizobium intechi]|nr:hypothetical protein [Mesorhizobium intechi]
MRRHTFDIENGFGRPLQNRRSPLLSKDLAMDRVAHDGEVNPCVEVIEACGEWFVRVVDGDEELTRAFELESFALTYAEGQRRRLGLADFDRL